MIKQKLAMLLGTFLLLTSILLPAVVSAEAQTGTVDVAGNTDVYFEGYTGANNPNSVTFTGVTASPSTQETTLNITADDWTVDQYIGVIDQTAADTWTLTVSTTAVFTGGSESFTANPFQAVTSVEEDADASLTINSYSLTLDNDNLTDNLNLWYDDFGFYTWTADGTDFSAPLNEADAFDYTVDSADWDGASSITGAGQTMLLNSVDNGEQGIFMTGITFNIGVPGGTADETYTATITYTLA